MFYLLLLMVFLVWFGLVSACRKVIPRFFWSKNTCIHNGWHIVFSLVVVVVWHRRVSVWHRVLIYQTDLNSLTEIEQNKWTTTTKNQPEKRGGNHPCKHKSHFLFFVAYIVIVITWEFSITIVFFSWKKGKNIA